MEPTKATNKVSFTQHSELYPIDIIITHVPQMENFLSTLHPAGSLFLDVVNYKELINNFNCLREIVKESNLKLLTVKEILQYNRTELEKIAKSYLKYSLTENEAYCQLKSDQKEKIDYYASEQYKEMVLSKLDDDQLFDVVMTNPHYKIKYSKVNTNVEFEDITFNPLGNLLYCRDQQIVTQKGVVLGRFNAKIREHETPLMKHMWKNLGVDIVGEIPVGGTMEGGDFITVKDDLALMGIGIRTNFKAAQYMMENDILGCDRFGLVVDEKDLNQDRMHLDTFFNVLDNENVVMLDFENILREEGRDLRRKVVLYEKVKETSNGNTSNVLNVSSTNGTIEQNGSSSQYKEVPKDGYEVFGKYRRTKIYADFKEFLELEGYKILPINLDEQVDEITNFLNFGNGVIVCVNKNLIHHVKENNINVNVKYLDFEEVKKMYGALHCTTQVSRIRQVM